MHKKKVYSYKIITFEMGIINLGELSNKQFKK